ncbi:MAG: small-conductance mechanosensitive ion channel [Parcubacteria group bacterium Gr01-1014_46]|nr:MAG: small-conductance mechanosensitive ion channel [Parcubacteria group bacterium Gr01-1014_46]
MILDTWGSVLNASFQALWVGVITFIPNLVVAVVILCIGWAIGALVAKGISHFMKMIKFDEALDKAGFAQVVKRAGLDLNSGHFIGGLVKYFVIVVFLIASFDVLGLDQVTNFLRQIVTGYLPQLIIAVLVLMVGGVVGDVLARVVTASSKAANVAQANFLGVVSKWAVWVFAILVSLSQMGIAGAFIQTLFTGFVVAISLALGLSFGLGGQEAAGRAISRVQEKMSPHNH